MPRAGIADLERLITILHQEQNYDKTFLNGMLEHKTATMQWFRERQKEDLAAIGEAYGRITEACEAMLNTLNTQYDSIIDTLMKEVEFVEKHLRSYEDKNIVHEMFAAEISPARKDQNE